MVAVGILRSSGALDILCNFLSPIADAIGFPKEALPITFMRLVSSSASTGILLDVFKNYGPDSFIGRFVSVMMSCTETIVYTMSLYFMSIKVKQTRYTLAGALVANFVGVIASLLICKAYGDSLSIIKYAVSSQFMGDFSIAFYYTSKNYIFFHKPSPRISILDNSPALQAHLYYKPPKNNPKDKHLQPLNLCH